jgi:hypothetical protein
MTTWTGCAEVVSADPGSGRDYSRPFGSGYAGFWGFGMTAIPVEETLQPKQLKATVQGERYYWRQGSDDPSTWYIVDCRLAQRLTKDLPDRDLSSP